MRQCTYSCEENMGTRRKNSNGNSKSPKAFFYRVIKWNLHVCHHSECHNFIILPTQGCAILGSVIFCPSHLSMPKTSDKRMCKKMLCFHQRGWGIDYGSMAASSVSSRSALRKIVAESRSPVSLPDTVLCQDLKPCCSSLVWFLPLATDPNRTEKNASHPFTKTASLPSPSHSVPEIPYVLLCQIFFVQKNKTRKKTQKTWNSWGQRRRSQRKWKRVIWS